MNYTNLLLKRRSTCKRFIWGILLCPKTYHFRGFPKLICGLYKWEFGLLYSFIFLNLIEVVVSLVFSQSKCHQTKTQCVYETKNKFNSIKKNRKKNFQAGYKKVAKFIAKVVCIICNYMRERRSQKTLFFTSSFCIIKEYKKHNLWCYRLLHGITKLFLLNYKVYSDKNSNIWYTN